MVKSIRTNITYLKIDKKFIKQIEVVFLSLKPTYSMDGAGNVIQSNKVEETRIHIGGDENVDVFIEILNNIKKENKTTLAKP